MFEHTCEKQCMSTCERANELVKWQAASWRPGTRGGECRLTLRRYKRAPQQAVELARSGVREVEDWGTQAEEY